MQSVRSGMTRRTTPAAKPGKKKKERDKKVQNIEARNERTRTISESCLTQLSDASNSSQSEIITMTPSASSDSRVLCQRDATTAHEGGGNNTKTRHGHLSELERRIRPPSFSVSFGALYPLAMMFGGYDTHISPSVSPFCSGERGANGIVRPRSRVINERDIR